MPTTQQSYDSLFVEHFNQVLSYTQRLVGDISTAHRITEEVFAEAARYYRKGKSPSQPRALLYLLATARSREFLRKGNRKSLLQRIFSRDQPPVVQFTEAEAAGLSSDTSQRALSTLDFGDRVVVLLHDYCGLTYEEVARAADIGRSSVARDPDRARHQFKQAYDYIKF